MRRFVDLGCDCHFTLYLNFCGRKKLDIKTVNVHLRTIHTFLRLNLNEQSNKVQSYRKSTKIDALEQKICLFPN